MQNDECKMQNEGVGFADDFKLFPKEIPQFCILHFGPLQTVNLNITFPASGA